MPKPTTPKNLNVGGQQVLSYADTDHPTGVRWPYTAAVPSFRNDRYITPGNIVFLLPEEVADYHQDVDRSKFRGLGVPGF